MSEEPLTTFWAKSMYEVILSRDVEHEHDLEGGVVRFHAACSVLWERMRATPPEE